jgi:hypothetical protein
MSFIRNPKDFFAGLLFVAFGVAALVISQSYALGAASRMGPGYFPRLLGILLVGLGGLQSLLSFRSAHEAGEGWHWRPLFVVLVSVAAFSAVATWLGLVLASLVLVLISSAASTEFRWKEALISGAIQGAVAVIVFAYGLGLPLPIWPVFIVGG